MTTRVFLRPDVATIEANNGIGRVVHAQAKYLPRYDVELVGKAEQADVIAGHTHDYGAPRIDVAHLHGLYWTGDPGSGDYNNWHREANGNIIASVRRARAVTVPSRWVAMPFQRDMRINPVAIGHGIEPDEWAPGVNGGYVLWNKNRDGDVCNPVWAWHLAKAGVHVVSTFGPKDREPHPNLQVIGAQPSAAMKQVIRDADIYLATTKETFGIGTLEAMAAGVPVLGFSHGGTADLVTHQEDGWLAEPGDLDGLLRGLEYVRSHRARLSANARATAARYTWEQVIGQYAALYRQLAAAPEPTGVAVVITCHNYGQYIGECLESVLGQTYPVDDVIVVDDGSTDDSADVVRRFGTRVQLLEQPNQGVANARNNGVAMTRQPFVVCLDADDKLDPRYIDACRAEMLKDRGLGLTWTGLAILRGEQSAPTNWGAGTFDWEWQAGTGNPPHTNVPTGAMFRRSMWERAGGYIQAHAPGEDAEFYTRGLSVGFTARPATNLPFFIYRDHGHGAHRHLPYKPVDTWLPWMRDKAYPLGAPAPVVPDVRSYSTPKVSVIIPVGEFGHGDLVSDAIDSLLGQNMRDWEAIVIDDTKNGFLVNSQKLARYPFVRLFATGGMEGPGKARNIGLGHATAPLVLFLDADDQLAPGALAAMCYEYGATGGHYIYGDWQPMGEREVVREAEYNPSAWANFDDLAGKHSITVLMATADARRVRFDETLPAWEDWDFFAHAATLGIHGRRVDALTLFVRRSPDSRTARAFQAPGGIIEQLRAKYGGVLMGKCCGGNGAATLAAKQAWDGVPPEKAGGLSLQITSRGGGPVAAIDPNVIQPVRMEFIGKRTGAVTYQGARGSGRAYRGGNNPVNRFHNVHPDDVGVLESGGEWRRVAPVLTETAAPVTPTPPAPEPAKVAEDFARMAALANEGGGTATPASAAPAAVAEPMAAAITEQVGVVQTAEGLVKRKVTARKPGKNTPLKDLPPLDGAE